jgi:hypothetical protein
MSNTGISRRDLIKWGTFVGAALGLPHWKVLECLDHTLGKAYGATIAEPQTAATVIGYAPNGGLAHYTQFWGTTPQIAQRGANVPLHAAASAITLSANSKGAPLMGTNLYPFNNIPGLTNHASIFVCGVDETHSGVQDNLGTFRFNATTYWPALSTVVQSIDNATLPQIAIGANTLIGTATNQRPTARANNPDIFAGLFTKRLSKTGQALEMAKAGQNAPVFKAAFTTYARLLYASGVGRDRVDYMTGKTLDSGKASTEILAQNLGNILQPTTEELTRYGVNVAGTDAVVVNFAKTLITFKKAVERNLTRSVAVQAAQGNDPHGADPANGGRPEDRATWTALSKTWREFTIDMLAANQHFVATVAGDTTKSVTASSGWPDGLSQNGDLSMMFVLDTTARISDGFFGAAGPGVANRAISFNAATGAPDAAAGGPAAAAAVLSACVQAVSRKTANEPAGVVLSNTLGITRPAPLAT